MAPQEDLRQRTIQELLQAAKELACQPQDKAIGKRRRSDSETGATGSTSEDINDDRSLGSANKRQQVVQTLGRSQTMYTHRQFERRNAFLPRAMYIAVCSYLYVLLRWKWEIREDEFDEFVSCYPSWLQAYPMGQECSLSYHRWFSERVERRRTTGEPSETVEMRAVILTLDMLNQVVSENPYSVKMVESSMRHAMARSVVRR